jgi:hypothetical protein
MTWFRIDDSFYDHPKVFDAPDCAVSLWTRAGTWSARNLTDGFVPTGMPARLCGDPDTAVKELVRRGLWSRSSGGYQFRDWMDYQPSSDEVKALREKRAAAGRQGGLAKARGKAVGNSKVDNRMVTTGENPSVLEVQKTKDVDSLTSDNKQNPSKSQASASHVGKQNATPSRPVPSFDSGDFSRGGHLSNASAKKPSPKCPQHENETDPPPCGACRTARLASEQWDRDQSAASARCGLCDGDGWRWDPAGKHRGVTSERCDHRREQRATG